MTPLNAYNPKIVVKSSWLQLHAVKNVSLIQLFPIGVSTIKITVQPPTPFEGYIVYTIWLKHGIGGYLIMQQISLHVLRGAHATTCNSVNTLLFVQLVKLAAQVQEHHRRTKKH